MTSQSSPILAALTFIEEHLYDELTIQDLADVSGYSIFHFTRLFNQYIGLTPYDYLIRRRLSDASEALLTSEKRIIDIAQDFQFGSHETFTRAFSRLFAISPSQWRERGLTNKNLLLPPLGEDYLFVLNEIIDRKPTVITLEALNLLGWTLPTKNESDMAVFWQSLSQALPDYDIAQRWIVQMPSGEAVVPNSQFLGIRTDLKPNPPQLLVSYSVEAGEFLKISFNQKGKLAHVCAVLIFLYHAIIPKIRYKVVSPVILIHYTEQMELMVPVEKMNGE